MSKLKKSLPFIRLDQQHSPTPLYRQIYEAIRAPILSGELPAGMRIPATRLLAEELGVSRITVINAYEQLFAEGYLEGKIGAGTYVAAELPDHLLQPDLEKSSSPSRPLKTSPLRLSPFGQRLNSKDAGSVRVQTMTNFQPFQNGLTAIDEFPFQIWSRIATGWHRHPPPTVLGYGDPRGFRPLREAVAAHLKSARGVNCTAEQIIITAGAQQALDLITRIFLAEKDLAIIEDPGYAEARRVLNAAGAKVISVPVDDEGISLTALTKRGATARLVYVTPSHQYPLGVTMSLARRLALIEWARETNALIIEDDYNSEYRYAGRPLASLQGLDRNGRVIYVGTFSKTIFPSLRLGCLVVPPELVAVFTAARALTDVHSSLIDQAILAEFMSDGHFARHLRRMRTLYEERQQILIRECEKQLAGKIEVRKANAGMHLVGWLPKGISDKSIAERAQKHGLKLAPLSAYSAKNLKRGGLILGYTAFDGNQIRKGIRQLAKVLEAGVADDPI